jgi:hypothetical protein
MEATQMGNKLVFKKSGKAIGGGALTRVYSGTEVVGTIVHSVTGLYMVAFSDTRGRAYAHETYAAAQAQFGHKS